MHFIEPAAADTLFNCRASVGGTRTQPGTQTQRACPPSPPAELPSLQKHPFCNYKRRLMHAQTHIKTVQRTLSQWFHSDWQTSSRCRTLFPSALCSDLVTTNNKVAMGSSGHPGSSCQPTAKLQSASRDGYFSCSNQTMIITLISSSTSPALS